MSTIAIALPRALTTPQSSKLQRLLWALLMILLVWMPLVACDLHALVSNVSQHHLNTAACQLAIPTGEGGLPTNPLACALHCTQHTLLPQLQRFGLMLSPFVAALSVNLTQHYLRFDLPPPLPPPQL